MITWDEKILKLNKRHYNKSLVFDNGRFVTTVFYLAYKLSHKAFKLFCKNINKRDIIKDPITILDPFLKRSEFLISALRKLDDVYKSEFQNRVERFQFIFDNCLYAILDNRYISFLKETEYDLNFGEEIDLTTFKKHIYYCDLELGDFEDNIESKEGKNIKDMEFDIIIGNPPYQNESKTTQKPLWPKFMNIANDIANEGGYISLIVPKLWISSPIYTENTRKGSDLERCRMRNIVPYNLIYLALDTPKQYFDVGSEFSYYIINKTKHDDNKLTRVEFFNNGKIEYNSVQTNKYDKILNDLSNKALAVVNKILYSDLPKLEGDVIKNLNGFAGSGHMKTHPDKIYKYKNISTSAHYKKNKFFYSKIDNLHRKQKKVIFSISGYPGFFYDDGVLATCHHGRSIFVNNEIEAENLINYLNSKIFKFLTNIFPSSGLVVGIPKIIGLIPKVDFSISWTDEQLYKYFNLTQEEIDYIEENV